MCARSAKNTFDKKIVLDFRDDTEGGFLVLGDATQLEQVLLNLCINAHDAMTIMRSESEEYSGTLSVNLTRVRTDADFRSLYPDAHAPEYICIRVRDTGVGMDDYTIERVFDPFFTTKDKNRGTGLGLAMVYNIVRQHGGIIDVYSVQGSGTSFTVFYTRRGGRCDRAGGAPGPYQGSPWRGAHPHDRGRPGDTENLRKDTAGTRV